jgi:hypothetical protein
MLVAEIWVARLVASLALSGFVSRPLFKNLKIGDVSKGVANTVLPAKNIKMKSSAGQVPTIPPKYGSPLFSEGTIVLALVAIKAVCRESQSI